VLYGVGARLDVQPELLFALRQVDANDLVSQAAELSGKTSKTPAKAKVLDDAQLADVFGIEMDSPEVVPDAKKKIAGTRRTKPVEPPAAATKTPARASAKKKAEPQPTTPNSRPRKAKIQVTAEPAAARKSVN